MAYVGNLPPMPGVFPDYPAPVIRSCAQPCPALTRPQKITLGEMRAAGVRGLLICCSGARSVKGQMLHLFRRTLPSVYLTRSVLDLIGKREKSRGQFAVECLGSQAAQFDNVALDQG